MVGTNVFYVCGKSGNMVKDCPHMRNQARKDAQPRPTPIASAKPHKKKRFCGLKGREEQENSTDVVTCTLHVFSFPMYEFLDPGSTFSFVTPLVASKFDILPDILHEPILVSTPIGDIIRA